ncbi:hypothetical protein OIE51_05495 [Streptomyces sp. NBC_01803]|nr:hypothetical protein [Streptomyces sp. NBC_01803]WSA43702.1 hypothetical protein OIE51_05495 [Streptomyces sp. NBC_01803]
MAAAVDRSYCGIHPTLAAAGLLRPRDGAPARTASATTTIDPDTPKDTFS